jgi:hypothetical protein
MVDRAALRQMVKDFVRIRKGCMVKVVSVGIAGDEDQLPGGEACGGA